MPQLKQGLLIAIEGIDGSGKSTLAQNLFQLLEQQGFNTRLTKEPGDSALGKKIRELVQAQNIPISSKAQYLLFAADRAQHFEELIVPALQQRNLIISDRLADSSLAYQGYGNGLDLEMIKEINTWSMQSISVDLTIFVRISVEIALERCNHRGKLSAYEKRTGFLHKVAQGFEELYKNRDNVIIVDGAQNPEDVSKTTYHALEKWIQNKKLLS